jgi:hypothetical protein
MGSSSPARRGRSSFVGSWLSSHRTGRSARYSPACGIGQQSPRRSEVPADSHYIEAAGVVLDPMVPREGLEWFDGRQTPSQVVLTNRHHLRHSERYQQAFGCPIRCSEPGLHQFVHGPKVEGFAFGEELAPGVNAHQLGAVCPDDTALHIRTGERQRPGVRGRPYATTRRRAHFVPGFLMGDDPSAVRTGCASHSTECSPSISAASCSRMASR